MTREQLPDRRGNIGFELEDEGQRYTVMAGYYPDGRLAELFLNVGRPDSSLQASAENAAILVSIALQAGVPAETLLHSTSGAIAAAVRIASTI